MNRTVSSHLELDVTEPAELVFAVAASASHGVVRERFATRIDGRDLSPTEHSDTQGTRLHRVEAPVGRLVLDYDATVGTGSPARVTDVERFTYLRPSRYAESDTLAATAAAEFGGLDDPAQLLVAVSSWVGTRLRYLSGSSRPTDGAVSTLLAREGVCRDFAHLATALLRARGVAARTVAVYAPGLDPMDFHAVVEADIDGVWRVVDPTTLAPRSALVRIATGRDAADTAFLNVLSGRATLLDMTVTATADWLPADDLDVLTSIA